MQRAGMGISTRQSSVNLQISMQNAKSIALVTQPGD
jgi:hypothetical protein